MFHFLCFSIKEGTMKLTNRTTAEQKESKQEESLDFSEFLPTTYEDWKATAIIGLKGASFEKKMERMSIDGIHFPPIFHHDDPGTLRVSNQRVIRALDKEKGWRIGQICNESTHELLNQLLLQAVAKGQNEIRLVVSPVVPCNDVTDIGSKQDHVDGINGIPIESMADFERIFNGIESDIPIVLYCSDNAFSTMAFWAAVYQKSGSGYKQLRGVLGNSPIGQLVKTGIRKVTAEVQFDETAQLVKWANDNTTGLSTILVDSSVVQRGGATPIWEIAYCLSEAVCYISELTKRNIDIDAVVSQMAFQLSFGSDFFEDIAKQRALRMLFAGIVAVFGGKSNSQIKILGTTSMSNHSKDEPLNNVLRSITSTLSAAMGGVTSFHTAAHDEMLGATTGFSSRIARNVQVVLQQECHIGDVQDPLGGSYYIEQLTDKLAQASFELFGKIESQGGVIAALENSFIQHGVEQLYLRKEAILHKRKQKMVGVNDFVAVGDEKNTPCESGEYPTSKGTPSCNNFEPSTHSRGRAPSQTMEETILAALDGANAVDLSLRTGSDTVATQQIESIPLRRLAAGYEALRVRVRAIGASRGVPCRVLLLLYGKLRDYKARVDFARSFFAPGGFSIIESAPTNRTKDAVAQVTSSSADITVICSSDENYLIHGADLAIEIKAAATVGLLIAGRPAQREHERLFRDNGVDGFIYLGANQYEILDGLVRMIGGHHE